MDKKIIDGKKWAAVHQEKLKKRIAELKRVPYGVNILVGDDPSSVLFTQLKEKKARELGLNFETKKFEFPHSMWEAVCEEIKKLSEDSKVDGVMVQLPLPGKFVGGHTTDELLELIDPKKDIDGLTGKGPFPPAAVGAILSLLEDEGISMAGKKVVVVGASDLVGKPAALELQKLGVEVEVCDKQTADLKVKTMLADIIISATGVPHLIKGDMVKEGVVVIDVGAENVDGKLLGDVDFPSVYPKASKITPVPGGVGPVTVITLMENMVKLVNGHF